jgi:hypothetical protein
MNLARLTSRRSAGRAESHPGFVFRESDSPFRLN